MKGLINQSVLSRIADKIRERKATDRTFTPKQMVCAVEQIPLKKLVEGDFTKETVYLPDGIERISTGVFEFNEGEIILPKTVKIIANDAFGGIEQDEFIIPSSVTSIDNYAFSNAFIKKLRFMGPLPEHIDYNAFWASHNYPDMYIGEIHIPNIESWFNLKSGRYPESYKIYIDGKLAQQVEIPSGVESIRYATFRNWRDLNTVIIPESVKSVESYIVNPCPKLSKIIFKGKPDHIDSQAFSSIYNNNDDIVTIFVPWAEGEVTGAPWGATNAAIRYNYVSAGA